MVSGAAASTASYPAFRTTCNVQTQPRAVGVAVPLPPHPTTWYHIRHISPGLVPRPVAKARIVPKRARSLAHLPLSVPRHPPAPTLPRSHSSATHPQSRPGYYCLCLDRITGISPPDSRSRELKYTYSLRLSFLDKTSKAAFGNTWQVGGDGGCPLVGRERERVCVCVCVWWVKETRGSERFPT